MEEEQGGAGRERLSDDASNERYASAPHPRHTLLLLPERTTHQRTQSPQQHVQLLLAQSYLSCRPTAPTQHVQLLEPLHQVRHHHAVATRRGEVAEEVGRDVLAAHQRVENQRVDERPRGVRQRAGTAQHRTSRLCVTPPSCPNSLNALQPQRQTLVGVGGLLRLDRQLELRRVGLLHLQDLARTVADRVLPSVRRVVRGDAQQSVEPPDHVGIVLQLLEDDCVSDSPPPLTTALLLLLHALAAQAEQHLEGVGKIDAESEAVVEQTHKHLTVANLCDGGFDLLYCMTH